MLRTELSGFNSYLNDWYSMLRTDHSPILVHPAPPPPARPQLNTSPIFVLLAPVLVSAPSSPAPAPPFPGPLLLKAAGLLH